MNDGGGSSSSSKTTPTPAPTETPSPTETPEPTATDEPTQTEIPGDNPFSDVTENDWFYKLVLQAFKSGLMDGISDTEFAPETDITRAQAVAVFERIIENMK